MIVNNTMDIKHFYRFIEFTSKLLNIDLTHERFKLIVLDNYKAETKVEKDAKMFAESYLYLINNVNQTLTITIIKKAYYLLEDIILEDKICNNILEVYYKNYDETSNYLAALIHFAVLDNVKERKIEFAFMLSNLIMLKKKRNPFIPYEFMHEAYFKAIDNRNIDKLMLIFSEIEAHKKINNYNQIELNKDEIINKIKTNNQVLKTKYNVKNLYLYGSYAKDKITPNSDLDFLIIYDKELINFERCRNSEKLIKYLSDIFQVKVDLLDFSHAMTNLDINEMEDIITLI